MISYTSSYPYMIWYMILKRDIRIDNRQASFIKPLMAEQRRHISCVGDGGNRTHAVQVKELDLAFALTTQLRGQWLITHVIEHDIILETVWYRVSMTNIRYHSENYKIICDIVYDIDFLYHMILMTTLLAEWLRQNQGPVLRLGLNSRHSQHTICAFFALPWAV